jgi:heterotetrameric sarcosine oxidase gamma subunit
MADTAKGGCRLREITTWSLLQVVAWPDQVAAVEAVVATAIGAVPRERGALVRAGDCAVFRVAPDTIWMLCDGRTIPEIRIDSSQGCTTKLTDGRQRFRIEGPNARDALVKVVALDLDPAHFGIGQAALTGMHHVPVFLCRIDEDAYDIFMPRSFALDLVHWLADAALEFGASHPAEPPPPGQSAEGMHTARDLEAIA